MKRVRWGHVLLFAAPFVLLGIMTLQVGNTVRLDQDGRSFAQEVSHHISVGMPVVQAEEILKRSGFSRGATRTNLVRLGKWSPPPKELGFTITHSAFPLFLNKHHWRVWLLPQNGQVREVQTQYSYDRF